MKKKILVGLIGCMLAFSLVCCNQQTTINANVETNTEPSNTMPGIHSLKEIGDGLWYDSDTRIVYWWNGSLVYYYRNSTDTTPTAYYAPNGLPYRYNPETNTFEEIEN